MRKIGLLIVLVGLVGLIFFGYQAMQDSESFSVLGIDVAVSSANWTPVIISGVVFVAGLILAAVGNKK
ncbi:MAG: transglycosylase [Mariniphaga sp.]|nr:transglycosylase [Mariniphaga sp.]